MGKIKSEDLVKSLIGEEGYETLNKAISKMNTRSIVDISELHASIKIVPKVIMSFLLLYAKKMKPGSTKTLDLPWADNCHLLLNKRDQDVYSGYIDKDGKIEHEFDQVSIPQLAAHILSYFEMYDESSESDEREESSIDTGSNDKYQLSGKIVALLTLLTANVMGEKIVNKEKPKLEESKPEASRKEETSVHIEVNSPPVDMEKVEPAQKKSMKKNDLAKSLKKAMGNKQLEKAVTPSTSTAVKMPAPPKPGTKVGGNNGITKEGMHNDKTASTDMPGHDIKTHVANPDLKISNQAKSMFKLPKLPKLMASEPEEAPKHIPKITLSKGEYNSQCVDCGSRLSQCQCFNGLSKPVVVTRKDNVELKFKSDWDAESVLSLVRSIKSKKG